MMRYLLLLIFSFSFSFDLLSQDEIVMDNLPSYLSQVIVSPDQTYNQVIGNRSHSIALPFELVGHSHFQLEEMDMLDEQLVKARPDLKVYSITSMDGERVHGGLVLASGYLSATILTKKGIVSIYEKDGQYVLEQGIHHHEHHGAKCSDYHKDATERTRLNRLKEITESRIGITNGDKRRTYRLAVVCTGEYYELNGNSDSQVQNEIAAAVMDLNVLYGSEFAVRFNLLNPILYSDKNTDPFDPDGAGRTVQAAIAVDEVFNINSYDIGQVFHKSTSDDGWGTGGVAYRGVVCNPNFQSGGPLKAGGWSGSFVSGNSFLGILAHEVAHMFGAEHTFNGIGSSCTDAISETAAFEIGSGTTLMSYNGICDADQNIPSSGVADNYFHVHSVFQMVNYMNDDGTCASETPLNNSAPTVTPNECGGVIRIPENTPFYLKGSATDPENTNLLYCWEQYNQDGPGTPTQGDIGNAVANSTVAPLFRSFPPKTAPDRYFPDLKTLAEGASSDPFQVLPNRNRTLDFQLTVRDGNEDGGGIASAEVQVIVENNGPLRVQNVNSLDAGVTTSIAWSLNNTEDMCSKAKLLLSIDGGQTYPFTIASDLDYSSGSTDVTLSDAFPATGEGRLMLICDDSECYSFFDVSDNDITITSQCAAEASFLCDTEYQVYDQGDATLNLDLKGNNGLEMSSIEETIVQEVNEIRQRLVNDQGGSGCFVTGQSYPSKAIRFTVDEDGPYSFFVNTSIGGGAKYIAIHTADNYDQNDGCPSFLSSNATFTGTNFSISSALTQDLSACEEYIMTLIINTGTYPDNVSIPTIAGPGKVYRIEDQDPNFDMTFIAVNENGIIEVVSPTSDFTALSGGLYDIYTVNYKTGGAEPPSNVDPLTWVGQQLTAIQATNCMLLSTNKKEILVEFSCRINSIEAGMQTMCDEITNLYSQDVIITYESPPLTGQLLVNGVNFPITGSPQTITITGQISDGNAVDVSATFTEISSCTIFETELFTAPELCCGIEADLGEDKLICSGEEVILDAGDDGTTYVWLKDGELILGEEGQFLSVTESGNYSVNVIKNTTCSLFEVVNVTFFDSPSITIAEDEVSVCEGDLQTIQSDANATNLQWYKDDVLIMGQTSSSLLVIEPGTYRIEGTNTYNLPGGETFECLDSDEVIVVYVTRPIVDLGDDQSFCEGDPSIQLNAGQDGTSYQWANNGIVIPNETTDMLTVSESGFYTVIVEKGIGCDARDTVDIQYIPLAEIFAGQDINVCAGDMAELGSFINATSFEWFYNGMLYDDQSQSPEVTQGGEYVLVGLNEIGCEIRDTVVVTEVIPPDIELGDEKIGCIGSEILLSVDSVGQIMWRKDNSFFSSNASISITEPGTYSVTILAASNCIGNDEIEITFEPGPMLSLGNSDEAFCEGESYTINANTDGTAITWFQDGIEIIGESGFSLEVTTAGVYSAVVAGTTGCEVEDEIIISVNEVPNLQLDDDIVICDGESATLTTDFPADTYEWSLNGSVVSNDPEFSTTDPGVYTLVVVNQFGCSGEDIIEVKANARPSLDLDELFQLCEGEEATIEATSDASMFQWFIDDQLVDGEMGNTILVNTNASIEVIASSVDGCTTTAMTSVEVVSAPIVELGEDLSLCPNESIILNPGMHTGYEWSNNSTDPTINVFSDVNELITEIYAVTVTNGAGCTSIDDIMITLLPKVNATISQSAAGVCGGEPVELVASGGTIYEWLDDTGTLMDIDGPNATASPTETTTYQVIVMDDCPNNEDFEIVEIEVFEAAEDVDAGEDDCAINGKSVDLNASGGESYMWLADPSIDVGADSASPTVSPTEETTYFVDITDSNGCIYRDSVTICILDDPLEFFKLVSIITPNGDGDNDGLRFDGLEAFPENSLKIFNRWGYQVYGKKGYQIDDELWTGENGGDILPADTYYYVLTFNGETFKSSVTIMR